MPKRKQAEPGLETLAEADATLRVLGEAERRQEELVQAAQRKIDAIKAELAENLTEHKAAIKSTTKLLQRFLDTNRDLVSAGGRKTVDLHFGTIGFRTPPPSLVWMRGFTEADVIAAILRLYEEGTPLVTVTEAVCKDAVKDMLDKAEMARIGCELRQDDLYVIEPRIDAEAGRAEVA